MIRPIVGEGFFLSVAPRDPSALVCALEADYMVYVNEVAVLVGVEAYGGVWFVTAVVEVFAFVAVCNDN